MRNLTVISGILTVVLIVCIFILMKGIVKEETVLAETNKTDSDMKYSQKITEEYFYDVRQTSEDQFTFYKVNANEVSNQTSIENEIKLRDAIFEKNCVKISMDKNHNPVIILSKTEGQCLPPDAILELVTE